MGATKLRQLNQEMLEAFDFISDRTPHPQNHPSSSQLRHMSPEIRRHHLLILCSLPLLHWTCSPVSTQGLKDGTTLVFQKTQTRFGLSIPTQSLLSIAGGALRTHKPSIHKTKLFTFYQDAMHHDKLYYLSAGRGKTVNKHESGLITDLSFRPVNY